MDRLQLGDQLASPRRTAHEYVRNSLREGILRGSLVGGTRLVQSEIASELEVSTTPVREALRDLATEGLVQLDAHRGAVVLQLGGPRLGDGPLGDVTAMTEPVRASVSASPVGVP
jgi:DNA-binding GntR family transcriptional regulator